MKKSSNLCNLRVMSYNDQCCTLIMKLSEKFDHDIFVFDRRPQIRRRFFVITDPHRAGFRFCQCQNLFVQLPVEAVDLHFVVAEDSQTAGVLGGAVTVMPYVRMGIPFRS